MTWWIWTLIGIYVVGFVATMLLHMIYLQMVTLGLAMFRATVWPIFWATGGLAVTDGLVTESYRARDNG